jgi:hypothetical protein
MNSALCFHRGMQFNGSLRIAIAAGDVWTAAVDAVTQGWSISDSEIASLTKHGQL